MHPTDCPGWKYEDHPNRAQLKGRISALLVDLRKVHLDSKAIATDTRQLHRRFFEGLTPVGCDYYAGHYRGESFRCLRHYEVRVPADPRVGVPPSAVEFRMAELVAHIHSGLIALDGNVLFSPKERLRYVIALACNAFVTFLTIHPYANGNGHAGRLIVWCILGRYGFWPQKWAVEPRPADPPYSQLIMLYRSGNTQPLETYILGFLS